jgi:hypothetical protein
MYHGTYVDFDVFDPRNYFHCFTPYTAVAERHAKDSHWFFKGDPGGATILVMPVYLRVLRPFDPRTKECRKLTDEWHLWYPELGNYGEWEDLEDVEIVERIKSLGFDGIWMRLSNHYDTLAVFSSSQVKSAIGNSGSFDPDSPSLTDRKAKRPGKARARNR